MLSSQLTGTYLVTSLSKAREDIRQIFLEDKATSQILRTKLRHARTHRELSDLLQPMTKIDFDTRTITLSEKNYAHSSPSALY